MTPEDVLRGVAAENGTTLKDLRYGGRSARLVLIRQQAMRRLRGRGLSLPEIAAELRMSCHSAVWHGLRGGRFK